LTGVFQCEGTDCPDEHQIDWTFSGPAGTQSGSFSDNDPYFGIHLLPTWFSQSGIYTLTLNGHCGSEMCPPCVLTFDVDCAQDPCPCEADDIAALSAAVDKGFAVSTANFSCKACFSPLALSDCEMVEWFVNTTSGTPLGMTNGNQTFCHNFGAAGSYNVNMVVTRKRADGSICEVFVKSQTVHITCAFVSDCTNPAIANPRFGINPIPGGLASGGEAPGWTAAAGDPKLLEGVPGSEDGWAMCLTGCYFSSDVLSSAESFCVAKGDTGTLTLRLRSPTPGDPIPGCDVVVGRKPPGSSSTIALYTGTNAPFPNCPDASCYTLATIEDLLPLDDGDWYNVSIPYKLSDWMALDSCGDGAGGIPVRLAVYVSNYLSEDQGPGPVRDGVAIDQICMDGLLVGLKGTLPAAPLRLYPNPSPGQFTLELPEPATPGTTLRIISLTGQVLMERRAEPGSKLHPLDLSALPGGMYFVQVWKEGLIEGVAKLVKQ
jgi:hypothetical protein